MKLFRLKEPKSSHPHAVAMSHLKNAHAALLKEQAQEAQQHIGRAFQAVSASLPKQAPAAPTLGTASTPSSPSAPTPPNPKQRFQQLTNRGMPS